MKNEDQKVELVNREGATYFVSTGKFEKITGLRKWEQAFQIYAAIYSRAQPHRSAEIWQYVDVIHLAASSYSWDNISAYDNIFRRLMAEYPDRSWSKTYTQMWNLSMRDPLTKQGNYFVDKDNRRRSRDNYCWKFQKNQKHDLSSCKFDHQCKYCDGHNHGFYNCRKRKGRKSSSDSSVKGDE